MRTAKEYTIAAYHPSQVVVVCHLIVFIVVVDYDDDVHVVC